MAGYTVLNEETWILLHIAYSLMISQSLNHILPWYTWVLDEAHMLHTPKGVQNYRDSHHALPNSTHSVPTKENVGLQMNDSNISIDITEYTFNF